MRFSVCFAFIGIIVFLSGCFPHKLIERITYLSQKPRGYESFYIVNGTPLHTEWDIDRERIVYGENAFPWFDAILEMRFLCKSGLEDRCRLYENRFEKTSAAGDEIRVAYLAYKKDRYYICDGPTVVAEYGVNEGPIKTSRAYGNRLLYQQFKSRNRATNYCYDASSGIVCEYPEYGFYYNDSLFVEDYDEEKQTFEVTKDGRVKWRMEGVYSCDYALTNYGADMWLRTDKGIVMADIVTGEMPLVIENAVKYLEDYDYKFRSEKTNLSAFLMDDGKVMLYRFGEGEIARFDGIIPESGWLKETFAVEIGGQVHLYHNGKVDPRGYDAIFSCELIEGIPAYVVVKDKNKWSVVWGEKEHPWVKGIRYGRGTGIWVDQARVYNGKLAYLVNEKDDYGFNPGRVVFGDKVYPRALYDKERMAFLDGELYYMAKPLGVRKPYKVAKFKAYCEGKETEYQYVWQIEDDLWVLELSEGEKQYVKKGEKLFGPFKVLEKYRTTHKGYTPVIRYTKGGKRFFIVGVEGEQAVIDEDGREHFRGAVKDAEIIDGKLLILAAEGGRQYLVVDGKRGKRYAQIGSGKYLSTRLPGADENRLSSVTDEIFVYNGEIVYSATRENGKAVLIAGERELPGFNFDKIIGFGPLAGHIACIGEREDENGQKGEYVVYRGTTSGPWDDVAILRIVCGKLYFHAQKLDMGKGLEKHVIVWGEQTFPLAVYETKR